MNAALDASCQAAEAPRLARLAEVTLAEVTLAALSADVAERLAAPGRDGPAVPETAERRSKAGALGEHPAGVGRPCLDF